ncbi:hypothetical protein Nmel_007795, partial [Mimus melanotis]
MCCKHIPNKQDDFHLGVSNCTLGGGTDHQAAEADSTRELAQEEADLAHLQEKIERIREDASKSRGEDTGDTEDVSRRRGEDKGDREEVSRGRGEDREGRGQRPQAIGKSECRYDAIKLKLGTICLEALTQLYFKLEFHFAPAKSAPVSCSVVNPARFHIPGSTH